MTVTATRYVAFLRAINVGARRVKMPHLRELFEALDLDDVQTFLASGNAIFRHDGADGTALARTIEDHLEQALGFPVDTFVRSLPEVARVATADPFRDLAPTPADKRYVSFLHQPLDSAQREALSTLGDDVIELRGTGREIYWLRRMNRGDSRLSNADVERALGVAATRRNLNTVRRIAERFGGVG